jgi:outer membrane protein assembly factor BamB/tetratricopeptide (TPR) repeat protein
MNIPHIFCPTCGKLILNEPHCPGCGWVRTGAPGIEIGQVVWEVDAGRSNLSAWSDGADGAAGADGQLFAGWRDGALRRIDLKGGAVRWTSQLPAGWQAQERIEVDADRIYCGIHQTEGIGSRDKLPIALHRESGDEIWRGDVEPVRELGSPLCVDGVVYTLTSDRALLALDAESGRLRWQRDVGFWGTGAPIHRDGLLYFGARGPTLSALDVSDGRAVWRFDAGVEEAWFPRTPTLDHDILFAPNWNGVLYALDPGTGNELWRFSGQRYMLSRVAIWEDMVFITNRDHKLYVLTRAGGELLWSHYFERAVYCTPAIDDEGILYIAESGGLVHAFHARSGDTLWSEKVEGRLWDGCEPILRGDEWVIGLRKGEIVSLRRRAAEEALDGATYEAAGQWEDAAAAYALAGDLAGAARLYAEQLGQPESAGQLLEAASAWEDAGRQYELANRLDDAERVYRRGKQHLSVAGLLMAQDRFLEAAEHYLAAGEPLLSANAFEIGGQLAEAASAYDKAGNTARAVELLRKLGKPHMAAELMVLREKRYVDAAEEFLKLGEWSRAASLFDAAEEFGRAADLYREHGERRSAAERYEKAGQMREAAEQYRAAGDHASAQRLFAELGDRLSEAKEWEKLGDHQRAGQLYEAAAAMQEEGDRPDVALAPIYDAAADAYERAFDSGRADVCRRRMRFHARLPFLRLELHPDEKYLVGHLNRVDLRVINAGFGVAREIQLKVQSEFFDFHFQDEPYLPGLREGDAGALQLYVQPKEPGRRVPFDIIVIYSGPRDESASCRLKADVTVHEKVTDTLTPVMQVYHVQGDNIQGNAEITHGDRLGDRAQKIEGDAVQTTRATVTCHTVDGAETPVETSGVCPACKAPIRPGNRYCLECGKPLQNP